MHESVYHGEYQTIGGGYALVCTLESKQLQGCTLIKDLMQKGPIHLLMFIHTLANYIENPNFLEQMAR